MIHKRVLAVLARLGQVPRALRLVWAAAPGWTAAWLALLALQGILPAATVYLTRSLVDSLVVAVGDDRSWQALQPVLILAGLMAAILLLAELLQSAGEWVRTAQAEFIQDHVKQIIHDQSTALDLAYYESPAYHDRLHRVQSDAAGRPLALLESSGSLLQNAITLLAMGAILLPYGAWLPFALLAGTLPAFYIVFHFNRRYHLWWEQTTADRRWTHYYDAALTHAVFAAELRLFDLGSHFRAAYRDLRQRLRGERLELTRDQGLARLAAGGFAVVVAGAAMAWMVWRAWQGLATLGDLALFYQAFNRGQSLLQTLLANIGQIYKNGLFLGNLFEFLALQPQVADPATPAPLPRPLQVGIAFRQVTFRYPGADQPTLQAFDLEIPAGQIVAIVGANGAGKTTLVKLLCRFYDVEAGRIELDGIDLRDLPLQQLRRSITGLFQFPIPYQATAAQNIALGDLAAEPALAAVETAARGAGAHELITRLPQGYHTLLGKAFANGAELSGGEWQRLALARTFFKQAQVIILDEPTSFMDSWAESDWLARFRSLVAGKTAVLITHRFTTAMQADVIHVMDQGEIVESGSHEELLALNGRYARSWRAQISGARGAGQAPANGQITGKHEAAIEHHHAGRTGR